MYPSGAQVAAKLEANRQKLEKAKAFAGFDGFIDEIIRVVKTRESSCNYTTFETISDFSRVLALAAGKSADLEIIVEQQKMGGNAPIMAAALARLGAQTVCCGALGYPEVHKAFNEGLGCKAVSVCAQAHTLAFEFDDGKIMLANLAALDELTWERVARLGKDYLISELGGCSLIALVNWSLPLGVQRIWEGLLEHVMPDLPRGGRIIFFDLADPTKRTREDICKALKTIGRFACFGKAILGLNENEALKVYKAVFGSEPRDLIECAREILGFSGIDAAVIHPIDRAVVVSKDICVQIPGRVVEKPLLSTGGGDNFNAGFCAALLAGLEIDEAAVCGMATSGYYVEKGESPRFTDLIERLKSWY